MDKLKQYEIYVEELLLAIDENTHTGEDAFMGSYPMVPLHYIAEELENVRALQVKRACACCGTYLTPKEKLEGTRCFPCLKGNCHKCNGGG